MKGASNGLLFVFLVIIVAFVFMGISSAISNIQSSFTGNITGNGTVGFIPRFVNATTVNNSVIFQQNNRIGINRLDPADFDADLVVNNQIVNLQGNITSSEITANDLLYVNSIKDISGDEINILSEFVAIGGLFTQDVRISNLGDLLVGSAVASPIERLDVRGNANITGTVNLTKLCFGNVGCMTSPASGSGGSSFNQSLNTSDDVMFDLLNITRDISFLGILQPHYIYLENQTQNEIDGIALNIIGGKGGDATSIGGNPGGQILIKAGEGGRDGTGSTNAGMGGTLNLSGGNGGNATSVGSASGIGGIVDIRSGDAGQLQTGNIRSGDILINSGRPRNSGQEGDIFLGTVRGAVYTKNLNVSQWLNVTKLNVTQGATFNRNITISNNKGGNGRGGITLMNESNRPVCVTILAMSLTILPGSCGQ